MFTLGRRHNGISVHWEAADAALSRLFRDELLLRGLSRAEEWENGLVVDRYRNELETLELVLSALRDIGGDVSIDSAVAEFQAENEAEREQLRRARKAKHTGRVASTLPEFESGRKLLPYQRAAVARHLACRNAADFSVPGSGKTTVAYAYWAHARREEPRLGLWVIGPLSCFRPWEDEFAACFGRTPRSLRVSGTASQRARLLSQADNADLVLASYQGVRRDLPRFAERMARRPWLLVLDEAHYIKSPTGAVAQAVRELAPYAARRLVLTGTPMPRSPLDLWSQFTFLWPSQELLGNAEHFQIRCRRPPTAVVPELRDELRPFFHRTCKSDLGLKSPKGSYPVLPAESVPASQRLLLRLLERRTLQEAEHLSGRDRRFLRRWRRARMIRLLQAVSNPLLLAEALTADDLWLSDTDDAPSEIPEDEKALSLEAKSDLASALRQYAQERTSPAKVRFIEEACRRLINEGRKVVIWTVFLGNVRYLENVLRDLKPLSITGAVPLQEGDEDSDEELSREQRVQLFKQDPDRRVLIANMGACSESISLHKASQHALYLERSFNAAQFVQSLDRIHRQGMPTGTTANFVIPSIPCAIERVLNRRLLERQRLLYDLLDDPMPVVGFDDADHRGLFDVDEYQSIDEVFAEVLREIRQDVKTFSSE